MAVLLSSSHDSTNGTAATAAYYGLGALVDTSGNGQALFSSTWKRPGSSGATSLRIDGTGGNFVFRYKAGVALDKVAMRGYVYIPVAPPLSTPFFRTLELPASGATGHVRFVSNGTIALYSGSTEVWQSTQTYIDRPVRVEYRYNRTTGLIRCNLYADANLETTTITETSGDRTLVVGQAAAQNVAWGWASAVGALIYIDDLEIHDDRDSFIGPVGGTTNPPGANFTMDSTGGDVPLTVNFTDTSTGTPTSWDWDWGDGTAHGTTQNPSHTYTTANTYTITLTATNAGGSTTFSRQITTTTPTVTSGVPTWVRVAGVLNEVTGAQRKVRVGGTLQTITTINGITDVVDPGDPDPPLPGTARFPGDPGKGHLYIGCNRNPDVAGSELTKIKWFEDRMSAWATTGVSQPFTTEHPVQTDGAAHRRPVQIIRTYGELNGASTAQTQNYTYTYPEKTDTRDVSRRLIEWAHNYGAIPYCQVSLRNTGINGGSDANHGYMYALADAHDSNLTGLTGNALTAANYVRNTLAPHLSVFSPNPIWLALDHEPEDNLTMAQPANQEAFRKAQRALILLLRQEGVDNVAFVAVTYMTISLKNSSGRDHRYWYPDWKGTKVANSTPDNPMPGGNTTDYYTGTTRTGAMNERVVDIIGHDVYHWAREWQPTTSITNADGFQYDDWDNDVSAAHALKYFQYLGIPQVIGELGTQPAGYTDAQGNLIQRTKDRNFMRELGLRWGHLIDAGALVGVCYFVNFNVEYAVDPNFSRALPLAELHDKYGLAPPIQ